MLVYADLQAEREEHDDKDRAKEEVQTQGSMVQGKEWEGTVLVHDACRRCRHAILIAHSGDEHENVHGHHVESSARQGFQKSQSLRHKSLTTMAQSCEYKTAMAMVNGSNSRRKQWSTISMVDGGNGRRWQW